MAEQPGLCLTWLDTLKTGSLMTGLISKITFLPLGSSLSSATYSHPLTGEELPFLAGSHVTADKGTGLVHTAPAHGHDDFHLALSHNIKVVRI